MTEGRGPASEEVQAAIARSLAAARQALLLEPALAGVPLLMVEEVLAALTGAAVAASLEARFDQIVRRGHDGEHDDGHALTWLPKIARDYASIAVDRLGGVEGQRNLPKGRQRLADLAALAMASLDRLDRATKGGAS